MKTPTPPPDPYPNRSRNIRLSDAEWEDLERIAQLYSLAWGGIPSRTEAIRLLIRAEIARIDARE